MERLVAKATLVGEVVGSRVRTEEVVCYGQ